MSLDRVPLLSAQEQYSPIVQTMNDPVVLPYSNRKEENWNLFCSCIE